MRKKATMTILLASLYVFAVRPASAVNKETLEMMQQLDHIRQLLEATQKTVQELKSQVDALNAGAARFEQNQAQLQTQIIRQQRKLDDLDEMLSSTRLANEQHFANLHKALGQYRDEQQKAFNTLTGQTPTVVTTETAAPAPRPAASAPAAPPEGYVTDVKGDVITIDWGSSKGMQPGSRLAFYKASDKATRAGEIEITEVMDSDSSRARIVAINPGLKPEFGDIVRTE